MKESEFVELLNLYIDHEISREDAARLEAEVASSPERQRVYLQYCRMQKACSLLAEHYLDAVPEGERAEVIEPPRRIWQTGIYGAGLLAAACLTVLAVVRLHPPGGTSGVLAHVDTPVTATAVTAAATAVVASVPARTVASVQDRYPLQPVVDLHDLSLSGANANTADAILAANQNAMFAWMNAVQAPVQRPALNQQVFVVPAALQSPDSGALHRYSNPQAQVERAAFRFQR